MSKPTPIEELVERVERLLVRYAELQRTNELLTDQIDELTAERDQLKQRLAAARTRVDALLERISEPAEGEGQKDAA
ncbi:MAG: cell division protein ZapB [Hylemonella sp.]|uniref:cell division protein ZapB n=1 Tax=Hylemonella sp. TaxID=2066020 RepID=UPI0022C20131|nr:cell division protein ZapB [Hylemonella sp.]MCZ8251339.1 cell division protein ZapB [Hylemonella sp.]